MITRFRLCPPTFKRSKPRQCDGCGRKLIPGTAEGTAAREVVFLKSKQIACHSCIMASVNEAASELERLSLGPQPGEALYLQRYGKDEWAARVSLIDLDGTRHEQTVRYVVKEFKMRLV